ncbi:MAG TPA: hypothetical protein DCK95_09595 [Anaerolineaceae bacterium]|uniref:Nbr1 FW domain-containing protein n=1 Tax=Anaerolinea thermophila TaxID=167964 RepID=A0A101FXQ6_9CHLR|nr:MAG: hypothetical protein XD73_0704 [Anaerolinea thermophila]HAF62562.1 hypothetical protein [Anaerolineaceae bacterium]
MKRSVKALAAFAILAIIAVSCNYPLSNGQSEEDAVATSVAMTVEAVNAAAQQPTVIVQPTNTLPALPTATVPAATIAPAVPTNTTQPCNQVQFVSESPVDDTTYAPGATFTKRWTFKNIGTCTWNTNYKLVFVSGDAMSGTASTKLTESVEPGESVDLTVNLKAPSTSGTYKGVWNLQGDNGVNFAHFWVQIKVASEPFAVTGVNLSAVDGDNSDTCPHTFNYQAVITTNGAGTVTYYFTNGGTSTGTKSVTFDSAGSKTVTGSWDLTTSGNYEVKLYVDNPNHQWFGSLTLTCTS